METKICTKCNIEKEIENFYIRRTRNNQRKSICKQCESIQKATPVKFIPDLEGEEWRDILDFEGIYLVSNKERVKRIMHRKNTTQRIMKLSKNEGNYWRVCLTKDGKGHEKLLNRLVAMAFIPNPENKPEVNHLNGKDDNTPESLEWNTTLENIQHAWRVGLSTARKGEACTHSKLTEKEVLEIRASKYPSHRLSTIYKVSASQIVKILKRERWTHI